MKIVNVVGSRPSFVQMAPLLKQMRRHPALVPLLVHTGQHFDQGTPAQFFADLDLGAPDFALSLGAGSPAAQTSEVMRRLEPVLDATHPDLVLVVGDASATLAAAVTAAMLGIPVAHVEAGLRSGDGATPEEVNRRLTDAVADLLFVTEESARDNVLREGIAPEKVHLVGSVTIDALHAFRTRWEARPIFERLQLDAEHPYAVLTLHRPSNVDDPIALMNLLDALHALGRQLPIVFPLHPRVKQQLLRQGYLSRALPDAGKPVHDKGIAYLDPLGYLDFIALMSRARLVVTDSGGIQDETTILGVPCLTLRNATERSVTVTHGTNRVIGTDPARVVDEALRTLEQPPRAHRPLPLWDGHASERIVDILVDHKGGGRCA